MASSTRKEKILNSISPLALVAIVLLNLLLIYMNWVSLENERELLKEIKNNTDIGLENQEIGLIVSGQNQEMLQRIIDVQTQGNETFHNVLEFISANVNVTTTTTTRTTNQSDLS